MIACFALFLIGIPAVSATIDGWFSGFGSFLQNAFGLMPHYQSLQRGVLDISDLLYFVTLTGAFLVMNTYWLEGRKY
jgi:ABC-2 type transport system permease protein